MIGIILAQKTDGPEVIEVILGPRKTIDFLGRCTWILAGIILVLCVVSSHFF